MTKDEQRIDPVDLAVARRARAEQLAAEQLHQRRMNRGIRNGLLIALPVWVIVGVLVYLWVR